MKRFEVVHSEGTFGSSKVVRDNATGVLYLIMQEGFGAGMTVLVDRDGKPLVDENFAR